VGREGEDRGGKGRGKERGCGRARKVVCPGAHAGSRRACFQFSSTLNHQPYEGRPPLTRWWRKSLNMTVGESSLISLIR